MKYVEFYKKEFKGFVLKWKKRFEVHTTHNLIVRCKHCTMQKFNCIAHFFSCDHKNEKLKK